MREEDSRDITLTTWREFPAAIDRIKKDHGSLSVRPTHVLYRGVHDADYPLETTLERGSSPRGCLNAVNGVNAR